MRELALKGEGGGREGKGKGGARTGRRLTAVTMANRKRNERNEDNYKKSNDALWVKETRGNGKQKYF